MKASFKPVAVESYNVTIFIAGDEAEARAACRHICDQVGLCVTVTPTTYVYTGGEEAGVIVGLINYPRFPALESELWETAVRLAAYLCRALDQQSYTIQTREKTVWFSHRPEDAQADRNPEGGDGTAPSRSDESTVGGNADAPEPSRHTSKGI